MRPARGWWAVSSLWDELRALDAEIVELDQARLRRERRSLAIARGAIQKTDNLLELIPRVQHTRGPLRRAVGLLSFEITKRSARPAPPPEPASASEVNWFNGPSFVGSGAVEGVGHAVARLIRGGES